MDTDFAKYINFLHLINSIFIYMAWYFIPIEYLKYYILFLLLIIIHWFLLEGHCILTVIEYKILDKKLVHVGYDYAPFLKNILLKAGYDFDESFLASLCYISVFTLVFFAIVRLNMHKKC